MYLVNAFFQGKLYYEVKSPSILAAVQWMRGLIAYGEPSFYVVIAEERFVGDGTHNKQLHILEDSSRGIWDDDVLYTLEREMGIKRKWRDKKNLKKWYRCEDWKQVPYKY